MDKVSVLVVEDEAMTAMYMKTMLLRKGYNVLRCISSGESAVDFAIKFNPDLVLMDIRLAGKMNGIEAAVKIKSGSKTVIQFMFTTGYSDHEIQKQAKQLEPLGFYIKPVNIHEMVKVIDSFFPKQVK